MEDLPLARIAGLLREVAVKDLPLGRTLMMMMTINRGRRVIGILGSLIWSRTVMELIFNPCGEFR